MKEQTSIFDTKEREVEIVGEIDSATGKITFYDKVTETIKVEINSFINPPPIISPKPLSKPLTSPNLAPKDSIN